MYTVITYQAPNGATLRISTDAVKAMETQGVWPRNSRGEEYCTVSHGKHVESSVDVTVDNIDDFT